jgi:glyoxylase-like metal-dependent hydrolase (beta-lactamase superfamily II)
MKLHIIRAEDWKMDGGAGFGLVPKTIWSRQYPADENNNILMSSRLLLVEVDDRRILIDTGMGQKRGEKYYSHKYILADHQLEKSLKEAGFSFSDITDVLLTHLHDDHVGGATYFDGEKVQLTFPNATHWVSKSQWDWAMHPNKREAGTYFKDNFIPLLDANKLRFIEGDGMHLPNIEFRIYNGHTVGNIVPIIQINGKQIAFMGDFIPFVASIPLPFISSTDIQPLLSLSEKEAFLNEAAEKEIYLFFEHDYYHELCTVEQTFKRVAYKQTFKLAELI